MNKTNCMIGKEKIRKIILLETDRNKKGDLFNRLAYDVFHALGFGEPRFNLPRLGREIDIVVQHRTENRVALAECKAHADKVGGADVNKFIGALDVERGIYEWRNSSVVGYFISQSGFTETVYEQEEERNRARRERNEKFEVILLGPDEIVHELIQGHVICSLEQAASAVKYPGEGLCLCDYADLLACEEGWIWVLYYGRLPKQEATHFAFVHADGNQLLNRIADTILQRAKGQDTFFSGLSYRKAETGKIIDGKAAQEAYFRYLKNELGEIQFEGMPVDKEAGAMKVDLEHIFVPLLFYDNDIEKRYGEHEEEDEEFVDINFTIEEVLNRSLRAAILAKPGGGKSTLVRRIALAYAYPERRLRVDDGLPDKDWFPVYIRCRDLENNATKSIMEIIGTIVRRAEITMYESAFNSLIENALQDGRILLLVDGLDEISKEKHRICFADQLRTFVATYPGVRLLITSREAGFRAVAGTIASYCRRYSICELDREQIRLLSLKWHRAILGDSGQVEIDSDKLCDMILSDARIVALAGNPLLLTTLLFVKRCVGYLPTKRCRLYEEMIKLLLVTWNAMAHDKLDMDETEPQLAFVAYCMMERGQQKITRDELESCIIRARKELPEILDYTTVSPSKFIEQVEERSSLLIQIGYEENDRGRMVAFYEFSHLSFQEYLVAKAIVEQWFPNSRNVNLLKALEPYLEEGYWREVIPLAAFLSGRDARPLIEELVRRNIAYEAMEENGNNNRRSIGNRARIIALHLANCIANEVPMNQELLKESILMIIKRKSLLDEWQRSYVLLTSNNVFDTIANSKYGNSYREILRNRLFHHYEDKCVDELSDLWIRLFVLEYENGFGLENILALLKSGDYQKKVTGALLMADYMGNRKYLNLERYPEEETIHEIFSVIRQMLKVEDELSIYSAARSIIWSGYGKTDMIPHEAVHDLAERLIELWSADAAPNLRQAISWALINVCTPELKIQNRNGLEEAIEDRFNNPYNDYDRVAAAHIALLTDHWSSEETGNRLKQSKDVHKLYWTGSRFLREMGVCPIKARYFQYEKTR